jgi:PAS domain S-box-containing protein
MRPDMVLAGNYDERLVALSILIAMMGSYCTIELAERVCAARGRARFYWILRGAAAMGIGMWSMHYTGIFAFRLPTPISYDWPTALLSWLLSFLASAIGFLVVSRWEMRFIPTLLPSIFMGGGISAMHYTAMESMRLEATANYSIPLVAISVILAMLISFASLRIMFHFRDEPSGQKFRKAVSALLLGAAIPVMHYTAMAAVSFSLPGSVPDLSHAVSISSLGAAGIGITCVMVLVVGLLTSLADRLQKQKEILQKIFDHIPLMISFSDKEGHLNLVNREWERVRGWSLKEVQEQNIDVVAKSYPNKAERQKAREFISEATGEWADFKARMKDGKSIDISWAVVRLSGGTVIGISQDVSERKQAEEALRQAQSRIESVLNSVADIHILFDRNWRFLYVNEAAVRTIGRPREEILGYILWEIYPDIVGTELDRHYRRAMDQRVHVAFEFHYPALNTWWENRFYPTPEGLSVFATNITERKLAEKALGNTERKYREIFQNAIEGIFQIKPGGGYISSNPALARMLGFSSPEELIQERSDSSKARYVDLGRHEEYLRLLAEQDYVRDFEYEDYRKDGSAIWLSDNVHAVRDSDGTLLYYEGTTQDITARKLAEQALRESEERYRELFENASEGIFQSTPDGRFLTANPALAAIHGFDSPEELIRSRRDISRQIYVDSRRREEFKRLLDEHGIVRGFEHQVYRKDGSKIWITVNARAVRNQQGKVVYYEGTAQDITKRKLAEQALRESEERYRMLFENAKDVTYVHDLSGKYTSVNRAVEKLTGYTKAEILEKSFIHFVPAGQIENIRQQLCRKLVEEGETSYESEVITKDGRCIAVEVNSHLIYEDGVAVGVQGTARDITERKAAEEKLKANSEQLRALSARLQSAREEEGTRIAREIHDELGSALTSLKWDLEEIDKLLSSPLKQSTLAEARKKLHAPMKLTDLAIIAVRRIASELRPSLLDDLGLVAAIQWQAQQFQTRTGIVCHCKCSLEIVELRQEQSTAVFRIFQEALTNVLRHAHATRVDIKLKKDDGYFMLSISDNGKGITEGEKSQQQSLGILGMRERAHLIGGKIEIRGVRGQGTVVIVRVPMSGQDKVLTMTS